MMMGSDEIARQWLIHMTGSRKKKNQGYRNFALVDPRSEGGRELEEMAKLGLVLFRGTRNKSDLYSATRLGCELIEMTKAGINRALSYAEED